MVEFQFDKAGQIRTKTVIIEEQLKKTQTAKLSFAS